MTFSKQANKGKNWNVVWHQKMQAFLHQETLQRVETPSTQW